MSDLLADLGEEERDELLGLEDKRQVAAVAKFVNSFPYVELSYTIATEVEEINTAEPIAVRVHLEKDDEEEEEGDESLVVQSAFYPTRKLVQWWVVIGDPGTRNLLAIKKVTIRKTLDLELEISLPKQGRYEGLKIWLVCDSYLGADREVVMEPLDVAQGQEESDDEDEEDDEEEESGEEAEE